VAARNITYQEPNDTQYDNGETLNLDFKHSFGTAGAEDRHPERRPSGRPARHRDPVRDRRDAIETPPWSAAAAHGECRTYNFVDLNVYGRAGPDALPTR